jgi:hypothetical protein
MRHSPAASAATTAPGGTATPPARLQAARRGRPRPRSRPSADRSVNARRSPVLRPSPTGIEGRRCKLQASLSFGRRPAAHQALCEAPPCPFPHPARAERGPCHHRPLSARPDRARPNGFGARSEGRSGLRCSGPHGVAIGDPIFSHWRIPGADGKRPFANECNRAVNEVCSNSRITTLARQALSDPLEAHRQGRPRRRRRRRVCDAGLRRPRKE